MKARSHRDNDLPSYGRLNGTRGDGWCAEKNDEKQWLQVDLKNIFEVCAVATQGDVNGNQWVIDFKLEFSKSYESNWPAYKDAHGSELIFHREGGSHTINQHPLDVPVYARYIRFLPVTWKRRICLRVEVYGAAKCAEAQGMDSGAITDSQISASSQWDHNEAAYNGRLHFKEVTSGYKAGAWVVRTNNENQWLQIDLISRYIKVTRVATQGRTLTYSNDGVNFHIYRERGHREAKNFVGNTDRDTVVYHDLFPPIRARYIRFRPTAWHSTISMRVELYGCSECQDPFGMENGVISDEQISASSELKAAHAAKMGRLKAKAGTWLPSKNNVDQWLQIDLQKNDAIVTRVATQGLNTGSKWVTSFNLQYGNDEINFHYYMAQGEIVKKTFDGNDNRWTVVYHTLNPSITGRYIRFRPTNWKGGIAMRVELFGCSDVNECKNELDDCAPEAKCSNRYGSFICRCLPGYSGDGRFCNDIDECTTNVHNCDPWSVCNNTIGSFDCTCIKGYEGNGTTCLEIDECAISTHNCHGVAYCFNNPGSFSCECRKNYIGDGISCEADGDFSVTIRSISKDKYHATPVQRSVKSVLEALIQGLHNDLIVLKSTFEWSVVSEMELAVSESALETIVSQGTTEWTIKRRSVPAGIYQVKFNATITVGDPVSPQVLNAFDYGFIEVIAAPVRAIIDGGSSVRWGYKNIATVDGSLSYDADIGPGIHTGLNFTWSCRNDTSVSNTCFDSFRGERNINSTVIRIEPSKLEIDKTYFLRLSVSKDVRSSFTEMSFAIAAGEVPQVTLRCFVDCGPVVSASNKFRVTSECLNSPCNGSKYEWRLSKFNGSDNWVNIPILPNMTSTAVNATNMIIKKNSLSSRSKYNLTLFVTSWEGTYGFSVLLFETAGEPHNGYCMPSASEGVSLETEFTFKCFDWQDTSLPLTYEFSLGEEPISYGTSPSSVSTVLPAGSPENDFQLQVTIVIKNSVGVAVEQKLSIKVKPSSSLDLCVSSPEDVAIKLKGFVVLEGNKLDGFLNKGELSQAVQLGISVLKSANEKNECGLQLDPKDKALVC
ncbi:uncharacterized protein LOC111336838 [Stylophora pistillata]|uniref:uncharacterized protein LOC111336838 n=1 Tax=Stylophora pistillata TaxID=50429 RepID=UPI000C04D85A|nr:uncharacterized protein LOC111336838 [Stylophora pistillata]